MPNQLVRTPEEEKRWQQAKDQVKQAHGKNEVDFNEKDWHLVDQLMHKSESLEKIAMAGSHMGSPTSAVGGAALAAESIDHGRRFTKAGPKSGQSYAAKGLEEHAERIKKVKKVAKEIHGYLKDGHKANPEHDPELEKGVMKDVAIGAAMAAGLASASPIAPDRMQPINADGASSLHSHIHLHDELKHIAQIESSGGKNKNHVREVAGMHAGQQAAGETGLMPITINETIKRNPDLNKKYGFLLHKKPDEVTAHLNANKETEYDIANHHWDRLGRIFGSDVSKKAFAWRNGITAAKQATPQEIKDHPYVKTYNNYAEMKKSDPAFLAVQSKLTQLKDKLK